MQVKGIIFDLDGTLIDTIEDISGAANAMFSRNGLPTHEISHYLKWIGSGAVKFIERALVINVDKEQLMDYVSEFREIYGNNLHDKSKIYDGIPELLDELMARRIKLSILSNKPHPLTQKVCDFYLADWPFNPVFGQREDVPRKPDPAAAFEIAEMMKIEPGSILFVGDSENDILTATAAGMIPVAVSWGYGRLMNEPVEGMGNLLEQPSELLSFLT